MKAPRNRRSDFARTFATPGVIALVSGGGLIVALVGEGMIDLLAGAAVAVPVMAFGVAWLWRRT